MIITLEVQHVTVVFAAGPVNGPSKMRHVMDKNQDIQNSYLKAVDELGVLRDNLLKKEVRAPRQPAQERGTCSETTCSRKRYSPASQNFTGDAEFLVL